MLGGDNAKANKMLGAAKNEIKRVAIDMINNGKIKRNHLRSLGLRLNFDGNTNFAALKIFALNETKLEK